MTPLADWSEEVVEVPANGLTRTRDASSEERAQLSKLLEILSIDALSADYRINALAGGGWRLKGRLDAAVTQACVITLEPVHQTISEGYDVEFWPQSLKQAEAGDDGERNVLGNDDVEPLEHGRVPVGRIVFETLSAALDPYPRKEGAEFEWRDKKDGGQDQAPRPFDILSRLKDKR